MYKNPAAAPGFCCLEPFRQQRQVRHCTTQCLACRDRADADVQQGENSLPTDSPQRLVPNTRVLNGIQVRHTSHRHSAGKPISGAQPIG